MKINVEMTAEEFDGFLEYRKKKQLSDRTYEELRRKAYKLRTEILQSIQLDATKKEAKIDFEDAQEIVNLTYDI